MSNQNQGQPRSDSENRGASADEPRSGDYENWEHFNILIEQGLAKYLYEIGNGDLAEGIRTVTRFHRENGGKQGG